MATASTRKGAVDKSGAEANCRFDDRTGGRLFLAPGADNRRPARRLILNPAAGAWLTGAPPDPSIHCARVPLQLLHNRAPGP